jgi:threonine/homoserine/homoserine lactone efflux protein
MVAADELAFGLLLGFSLTIPPGPMNALIASVSVRSATAGFVTGLGAMTADLILAILVYTLRSFVDLDADLRAIYVVGAVVMAYLGYRLYARSRAPPVGAPAHSVSFAQALGVGLSNPAQILWWLTAGLAFAYLGGAILFVGLFAAILVWIVVFPTAIHRGSQRYPALGRWVGLGSSVIMFAFAGYFVYLAVVAP